MDVPPPSYDNNNSSTPPPEKQPPPSYDQTSTEASSSTLPTWTDLPPEQTPTLILDDTSIYSSTFPSRPLYELSNAPVKADRPCYGLEKVAYKSRDDTGEVKRKRKDHIYDISKQFDSTLGHLEIQGQRTSRLTYRKVTLQRGVSNSFWKVESVLKVAPEVKGDELLWKSEDGVLLAVEKRGVRDKQRNMVVMPRLEIRDGNMEQKVFDLLIAAWCGRVWQDSKEPLSWKKFKAVAFDGREGFRESCKFSNLFCSQPGQSMS